MAVILHVHVDGCLLKKNNTKIENNKQQGPPSTCYLFYLAQLLSVNFATVPGLPAHVDKRLLFRVFNPVKKCVNVFDMALY